jgi:hypothetical protein
MKRQQKTLWLVLGLLVLVSGCVTYQGPDQGSSTPTPELIQTIDVP